MKPSTLRRELLIPFALLFTTGVLLAGLAGFVAAPLLPSTQAALAFLLVIVLCDLAVVLVVGRRILARAVLRPLDRMGRVAGRIAEGDLSPRMEAQASRELNDLAESVNAMAQRLIEDQQLLSENVRSLDETNRELVLARDEVIRAARMASVGSLAAGLAHEVGNPLAALLGYVDVARGRLPAPDPGGRTEELDELLTLAREEVLRIDAIVRSLLTYARPDPSGAGTFDPHQVVRRVRELLEAQGKLDDVSVRWPAPEPGVRVRGDRQHLEQIVVNLLLNALDVLRGRSGARVDVELGLDTSPAPRYWYRRQDDPPDLDYSHRRRAAVPGPATPPASLLEAERRVRLVVRDNGPGIAEDLLDAIFDPFVTTKEPGKGTGLGLAICARLAEGLGGHIRVRNHPDGGAEFALVLPVEED